jgi:glycosyltransferase involved in cell wall biosynthesis
MRVLHVDSASGWRGGQNQVLLTAQGMAARNHEVLLACRAAGSLEARAREAGLAVRPIAFRGDLSPGAVFALRRAIRDFRPDVVQLHDPHALSAGLFAGRGGALRIATRRVDFHLRRALSRHKYRACDRVVAVSRAIAFVLEQDGLPQERVRLVYEGVRVREPQPGGREALAELGIPQGAPLVGNVAALTDHKDQKTLLEAAALLRPRVPDARVLIVGEGELRAELEACARALDLADRVVFAGFRSDLDRLMPAFSVFCLSSHKEGLGTSLLDAMNFARPIVATAAGGIPEAVEDGVSGRVVALREPRALADALAELLLDPVKAAAMGAAGRRRFEASFTAERMVEATLGVYQELL